MAWSEALAGRYRNRVEMRVPTSNGLAGSPWPIHKNPYAQGASGSTLSSRSNDTIIKASPSTAGTAHAQVLMVKPSAWLNVSDNCKPMGRRNATGYSSPSVSPILEPCVKARGDRSKAGDALDGRVRVTGTLSSGL